MINYRCCTVGQKFWTPGSDTDSHVQNQRIEQNYFAFVPNMYNVTYIIKKLYPVN